VIWRPDNHNPARSALLTLGLELRGEMAGRIAIDDHPWPASPGRVTGTVTSL
jgi:hypothetical protein